MKQQELRDHGLMETVTMKENLKVNPTGNIHRIVTAWQAKETVLFEERFFYVFCWNRYERDGETFSRRQKLSRRFTSLGECRAELSKEFTPFKGTFQDGITAVGNEEVMAMMDSLCE